MTCGKRDRHGRICEREADHTQRHRYSELVRVAPDRPWEPLDTYLKPSGTKRFAMKRGYPCRVDGLRGTWRVVSIEQHRDTGKVNVEVISDRTGQGRIFPAERLIYRRPGKTAKAAVV